MRASTQRATPSEADTTQAAIEAMTQTIVERWNPERIILFGSRARGQARLDSDIDLLVVVTNAMNTRETAIAILDTLKDFPYAKDIVVATSQQMEEYGPICGLVYHYALAEGRVLYEQCDPLQSDGSRLAS